MSVANLKLVQGLVFEEIRRLVAETIADSGCLDSGRSAMSLERAYPNCGMSPAQIAEEILRAAIPAGIAVEFSRAPMQDTA